MQATYSTWCVSYSTFCVFHINFWIWKICTFFLLHFVLSHKNSAPKKKYQSKQNLKFFSSSSKLFWILVGIACGMTSTNVLRTLIFVCVYHENERANSHTLKTFIEIRGTNHFVLFCHLRTNKYNAKMNQMLGGYQCWMVFVSFVEKPR